MRTPVDTTTEASSSARRRGAMAALALLPAIVPLGVAVGVALGALSTSPVVAWLSAPMLVAGASQMVLFTQVDDGSALVPAAFAAVLLNGRFAIFGAALAHRFGSVQPHWFRVIGPHYIVDQTYAMVVRDIDDADDDTTFRRYFMTAGTLLWAAWTTAVGLGILVGPIVPSQIPLELLLPASFVALLAPTITRPSELAAIFTGATCVLAVPGSSAGLVVAVIAGAAIGRGIARRP